MFKLKNKEFTFDVDVSELPCGLNGALYFVEMEADGGLSEYPGNKVCYSKPVKYVKILRLMLKLSLKNH